ncbi:PqiC family protein [Oceanimonas baumannii]|uniref:PqiC family protein n=1 Tax=Oceanimonas baumannii TaxID=129578 RepID=UPI001D18D85E|nr:ABC-type transport auxiliary lipoprotein family protein [Oceanimonas baumannii]MCC4264236.1 PqiC family protein [Oceanimonas baumannii]
MLTTPCLKPLAPILLALSLAACASSGNSASSADYLLPEHPATEQHNARLSVTVAPITTASFLDNDGIVMQVSPLEVHQARHHLWADPLPAQLRQLLIHRLSTALPEAQIIHRGEPQNKYSGREVRLQLSRFQGRFDGVALIRGHWQILDDSTTLLLQRSFTLEVPLNTDGYPELVRALAAGWEQVADELARALKQTVS